MKKSLSCALLAFSMNAAAGIQVDATRVVYDGARASASLSISNQSNDTYMVQTWLDSGDAAAMPEDLPVVATPPILKLTSKKEATLRFIYSGSGLPVDRESVLWVNVQEIPPAAKEANVLQVAIRTRIKLFYRPDGLGTTLQKEAETLKWRQSAQTLHIVNEGPLHITLGSIEVTDEAGRVWPVSADMVNPGETLQAPLPTGLGSARQVTFSYINDYGGHTQIKDIRLER